MSCPPKLAPECEFDSRDQWLDYVRAEHEKRDRDAYHKTAWIGWGIIFCMAGILLVCVRVAYIHYHTIQ